MFPSDFRTRLLFIHLGAASVKEYDAPWLANVNTVVRDTSGRFASKASTLKQKAEESVQRATDSAPVQTLVGATKLVAETGDIGIDTLAALLTDGEFRQVLGLEAELGIGKVINRLVENPQLEERVRQLSEQVSDDVFRQLEASDPNETVWEKLFRKKTPPAPAEGKSLKDRLERTAARFQVYQNALQQTEKSNTAFKVVSQFLRDGIYLAGAIAATVGPGIALPYLLTGSVDLLAVAESMVLSELIYEFEAQIPEDWNPWAKVGARAAMEVFSIAAVSSVNRLEREFLGNNLSSRYFVSKAVPRLQRQLESSKAAILKATGQERSQRLLQARGFKSLDELDDRIGSLAAKLPDNFTHRNPRAREAEDLIAFRRTLSAPEMSQRILNGDTFNDVWRDSAEKSFYNGILKSESRYGRELDEVMLARDEKELQSAYNRFMKKLTKGRPLPDKDILYGKGEVSLERGSFVQVHKSGGLSEKKGKLVSDAANRFDQIFGTNHQENMFIRNPHHWPYLAGGKGSKLSVKHLPPEVLAKHPELKNVKNLLNVGDTFSVFKWQESSLDMLKREARIPPGFRPQQGGEATIFHELAHALEIHKGLQHHTGQMLRARLRRLQKIIEKHVEGVSPEGVPSHAHLRAAKLLDIAEGYTNKIYPDGSTELLTTAAEKLTDPKSLQLGLRNDREKIMYLLSLAANT